LAAGMTQAELALAIGLRESQAVSNWERGVFKPSDANLAALCHKLGRSIGWFYEDHGHPALEREAA
jgi:transcriptional regulator with XRE-family HTH domain